MPLNIDWQQILLHLFNFIILAGGLSFLLFKPVRKFMEDRKNKYERSAAEHKQRLEESAAVKAERESKLSALGDELAERERSALAVTETKKKAILAGAQAQAEEIVREGRRQSESERAAFFASTEDEISRMVVSSAEKLLALKSNAESDKALYDEYLALAEREAAVPGISEASRRTLASRLENSAARSETEKKEELADIVAAAAASAIGKVGAAENSAVYDAFLREVNG